MDDNNIEVVEVMPEDNDIEIVEVLLDENNVEIMEVMDGEDQVPVNVVRDDDDFDGVFDVSPLYVIEEVIFHINNVTKPNTIVPHKLQVEQIAPAVAIEQPRAARAPLIDRLAGVQHPLPEPYNIGALNAVCRHCRARHFQCESTTSGHFSTCCNNGQMAVSGPRELTIAPYLLQTLSIEDSGEGKHYRKNIRRYNNTLAFAAFSSDFSPRRLPGRGPTMYAVQGQTYWTIANDLLGNEPVQRKYCQLYFVESGEANRIRAEQQQLQPATHRLLPSVLEDLDGLLRAINPFAQAFE